MNDTFYLKTGDTYPYYEIQVLDASGIPIDITGATVKATMKSADGTTVVFTNRTTGMVIVNGPNGQAEYQWQPGDTANPGQYFMTFQVTLATGKQFTVPVDPNVTAPVEVQA